MIKPSKIFLTFITSLIILSFCTGFIKLGSPEASSFKLKLLKFIGKPVVEKKKVSSLKIKWLGHAAFLITASIKSNLHGTSEIKILTEPYDPDSFWLSYKPITYEADIVTISNVKKSDILIENLQGDPEVFVAKTGKWETKGITIEGIFSYRDNNLGKSRGTNTIYVFEIENFRICHLGKVGHTMTKWGLSKIGRIDVLLIPVGGVYTIGSSDATKVVEQIKPKIVIPMHYKTDACDLAIEKVDNFINWKENIKRINASEIKILEELNDEQKNIILEHEL